MLSFLLFSISRAWQGFWRNAAMSLAATATMTLMLLLLAGFWIIQAGFLASLSYVEDKVGVVEGLEDGARSTELRALGIALIEPDASGLVDVDVLVADDGLPRDIRRIQPVMTSR